MIDLGFSDDGALHLYRNLDLRRREAVILDGDGIALRAGGAGHEGNSGQEAEQDYETTHRTSPIIDALRTQDANGPPAQVLIFTIELFQ